MIVSVQIKSFYFHQYFINKCLSMNHMRCNCLSSMVLFLWSTIFTASCLNIVSVVESPLNCLTCGSINRCTINILQLRLTFRRSVVNFDFLTFYFYSTYLNNSSKPIKCHNFVWIIIKLSEFLCFHSIHPIFHKHLDSDLMQMTKCHAIHSKKLMIFKQASDFSEIYSTIIKKNICFLTS